MARCVIHAARACLCPEAPFRCSEAGGCPPKRASSGPGPGVGFSAPSPQGGDPLHRVLLTLRLTWCLWHLEQARLPVAISPVITVLCCPRATLRAPGRTSSLPPGALLGPEEEKCLCQKPQDALWCAGGIIGWFHSAVSCRELQRPALLAFTALIRHLAGPSGGGNPKAGGLPTRCVQCPCQRGRTGS